MIRRLRIFSQIGMDGRMEQNGTKWDSFAGCGDADPICKSLMRNRLT
jgi:hypothetical protein